MISSLSLRDFRNYSELNLTFKSTVNVFIGQNGEGKTNLLEAIFFISMLRSFRTSQLKDLKKIGGKGFYIKSQVNIGQAWEQLLEVEYLDKRKLRMDGAPVSKASEFIQKFKAVAFSPDDILIVSGSSGLRRRYFDMLISTLHPEYLTILSDYLTVLKTRNVMLRSNNPDLTLMDVYEAMIAEKGCTIVDYRKKACEALKNEINGLINSIKADSVKFDIDYRFHSGTNNNELFQNRLKRDREKDKLKGYTSFGPQVDDFDFLYSGKLLRHFGSTGQCRLLALCLKLGKINLISKLEEGRGEKSKIVVLVDDVTGELDQVTKDAFYRIIKCADQMFFTFTEKIDDDFIKTCRNQK